MKKYQRDMRGYGQDKSWVKWPNGAKVALQFVLNYEEGGENCILHGDHASEAFLSEIVGAAPWPNQRHWNMESIYEYGARAGFWRLHELFTEFDVPVTIFGVATALARAPEQVDAMKRAGWEIASHGLKWIEHKDMSAEEERAQIAEALQLHFEVVGEMPRGWYTGRCSTNTVSLTALTQNFKYISDSYADDLPYWIEVDGKSQLVMPYTLDSNDMRFATPQGFNTGEDFFHYLKDAFDALYLEGERGAPKMLSIGLHCRLIGRPGRVMGLRRFLDYIATKPNVWCATREEIADYWCETYPHRARPQPSKMTEEAFVGAFGDMFEHSPWVAERAYQLEMGATHDSALGVSSLLNRAFRAASDEERLAVLCAHPDLAGKLAAAKRLTKSSTEEQKSAGLDELTDDERAEFTALNTAYVEKFGFPFIIAVRDNTKASILTAFKSRLENNKNQELAESARQVERIAALRIESWFDENA